MPGGVQEDEGRMSTFASGHGQDRGQKQRQSNIICTAARPITFFFVSGIKDLNEK